METTLTTTTSNGPEKKIGSHSLAIKKPTLTGKLCFQFDDEEHFELVDLHDNGPVDLKLPSPVIKKGEETKDSEMIFMSGDKKFRLFIKAV